MRKFHSIARESPSRNDLLKESDPFVQYIVVRQITNSEYNQKELLADTVQAVLKAENDLASKKEWKSYFDAWWSAAFRKVVLKAKDKHWHELADEKGTVSVGDVIVTIPIQRSKRKEFFTRLPSFQVLNQKLEKDIFSSSEEINQADYGFVLQAEMSLGKTLAQVSHGALKFSLEHKVSVSDLSGSVFAFSDQKSAFSNKFRNDSRISFIQDAGLTELDPGTKTVEIIEL